eukprot:6549846-Pyramimonas_sp.AAC.1
MSDLLRRRLHQQSRPPAGATRGGASYTTLQYTTIKDAGSSCGSRCAATRPCGLAVESRAPATGARRFPHRAEVEPRARTQHDAV